MIGRNKWLSEETGHRWSQRAFRISSLHTAHPQWDLRGPRSGCAGSVGGGQPQGSAWAASFPEQVSVSSRGPASRQPRCGREHACFVHPVFLCCFLWGVEPAGTLLTASRTLSAQRLGECGFGLSGEVEFHSRLPFLQARVQPGSPMEPPAPVRPWKVPEPGAPASPTSSQWPWTAVSLGPKTAACSEIEVSWCVDGLCPLAAQTDRGCPQPCITAGGQCCPVL